jgi:hypothetical protein
MRICDLPEDKIVVGMKVKSLVPPHDKIGVIVEIDMDDDHYAWILWEGDEKPYGGFYWNHCKCEVVE